MLQITHKKLTKQTLFYFRVNAEQLKVNQKDRNVSNHTSTNFLTKATLLAFYVNRNIYFLYIYIVLLT